MDLELIKRIGIAAAYKGGGVLMSHYGNVSRIDKKGVIDLVTEADTESESVIIETIQNVFTDHTILAEESGLSTGDADHQWIIDPLDGTTNFAHQIGLFSISIAFTLNGETVFGLVLNPQTRELFTAVKGKGASLNGRQIAVSTATTIAESYGRRSVPRLHQGGMIAIESVAIRMNID